MIGTKSKPRSKPRVESAVDKCKRLYPDTYWRIRGVCTFGAVDLDHHAARITLAVREGRL